MQTAPVAREKLFNMRMSAEEWARIEFLAKHYSLNAAGLIRMLVKREADFVAMSEQIERERAARPPAKLRVPIKQVPSKPQPPRSFSVRITDKPRGKR
ncbi:MAG: hypothetical protein ACLP1X_04490 [Polyangiaceae bacterium]